MLLFVSGRHAYLGFELELFAIESISFPIFLAASVFGCVRLLRGVDEAKLKFIFALVLVLLVVVSSLDFLFVLARLLVV